MTRDDRDEILCRRARLLAAALTGAGLAGLSGCEKNAACLSPPVREPYRPDAAGLVNADEPLGDASVTSDAGAAADPGVVRVEDDAGDPGAESPSMPEVRDGGWKRPIEVPRVCLFMNWIEPNEPDD